MTYETEVLASAQAVLTKNDRKDWDDISRRRFWKRDFPVLLKMAEAAVVYETALKECAKNSLIAVAALEEGDRIRSTAFPRGV